MVRGELLLNGPLWYIRDNGGGVAQHVSRDPALSGWALVGSGAKHQEHVLLIGGQDLHHLPLTYIYFILFQSHIVLSHQHGGDITAAAAAFTLWTNRHTHRLETPYTFNTIPVVNNTVGLNGSISTFTY